MSRAPWIDKARTTDRVIFGDPERDVDRCLVTWVANNRALRAAVERGFPLVISHESTFWDLFDELPADGPAGDPVGQAKKKFLLEHDLVVLRNHNAWDRWPEVGIPWAWARFLGLGAKPAAVGAHGYQLRYDIEPAPLDDFARRVAARCRELGEPSVQVIGDGSRPVSRIGIGTGCGCSIPAYLEMGCDCSIVCDDGSCYWSNIQWAEDLGHPVIRVNHGTSEEPGMITLTQYINANLPGLRAEHLPHSTMFRLSACRALPSSLLVD
jgi:putative NIF3 family GTP cyclohydrolase 1 type 2